MTTQTRTTRDIDVRPYGNNQIHGYTVTVTVTEVEETEHGEIPTSREAINQYAFELVGRDSIADSIRGEIPDVPSPAIYIGSSSVQNYYRSHAIDSVPVDVLEKLWTMRLTLLSNVDGGWSSWGGRPEFDDSKTHIDFSDAQVVDLSERIGEKKRADN